MPSSAQLPAPTLPEHRAVPAPDRSGPRGTVPRMEKGRWATYLVGLVLVVLAVANCLVYHARLTGGAALSPWEPAIAMEAVRLNHGLPLYAPGHVTHMYGPLLTLSVAAVMHLTGLNLLAIRAVFSILGPLLAGLLATVLCRRATSRERLAAFTLFCAVDLRTYFSFASAQPDCLAALVAFVAFLFWVNGGKSVLQRALAVALFLVAFLIKTTERRALPDPAGAGFPLGAATGARDRAFLHPGAECGRAHRCASAAVAGAFCGADHGAGGRACATEPRRVRRGFISWVLCGFLSRARVVAATGPADRSASAVDLFGAPRARADWHLDRGQERRLLQLPALRLPRARRARCFGVSGHVELGPENFAGARARRGGDSFDRAPLFLLPRVRREDRILVCAAWRRVQSRRGRPCPRDRRPRCESAGPDDRLPRERLHRRIRFLLAGSAYALWVRRR